MTKHQRIATLLSFLDRGIAAREDVAEFLALYAGVFGACSASVAEGHGFFPWACIHEIPGAWLATHRRLQQQDPSPSHLVDAPSGSTFRVVDDSTAVHRELPLFHALHAHGYADAAISTIHNPFGAKLFTALYREEGEAVFSPEDATLIRVLHPHVARAFATLSARDALAPRGPTNEASARRHARAHAYLSGDEIAWSERARAFFLVESQIGTTLTALERAIRAEIAHWRTSRGPRTFRLAGVRVDHVDLRAERGAPGRTLLLFHDDRVRLPTLGPAARLLSPAQRRAVEEILRGRTIEEAARTLHVSPETIRTHVRAACRRLGVTRRTQLIARLLET